MYSCNSPEDHDYGPEGIPSGKEKKNQLGTDSCTYIYMGPKIKESQTTDVDYRNHNVLVYSDLIEDVVVGATEAPLLKQMFLSPYLKDIMKTYVFPNLLFHPMRGHCVFRRQCQ